MVSGTTLSGQPENIRGVGVVCRRYLETKGSKFAQKLSKWGAAGKARVDIMPPLEFVAFPKLPTQQNNTSIAK
jgi:hypothetical protein